MHVLDVLQPTRANRLSLLKAESEKNFREREMSSVLQDLGVREKIGELFNKVKGATGENCWRAFPFKLSVDRTLLHCCSWKLGTFSTLSEDKCWSEHESQ